MIGVFIIGVAYGIYLYVNKLMSHHATKKKGELIW